MGLVFHLAEIAVLLAIAYAVGWVVGYGLHRITVQSQRPAAAIPPERLAAATGAVPVEVATADAPAPTVETAAVVVEAVAAVAEAQPAVAAPVESPKPTSAQPASRPGLAWAGPRKGVEAVPYTPPPPPVVPVPVEPPTAAAPEPVAAAPVEPAPAPPPVVPPKVLRDDAEAMRAIEAIGNPSVAAPVEEAKAAVSAAQAAVEQMLARSGINPPKPEGGDQAFGKPVGLPRPRDGVRDDLRRIAGIGPLDVNVLNNLGIFHFDQIAALTEREIAWLENHAFQRGRIAREGWQEQASTMAEGGREPLQTLH